MFKKIKQGIEDTTKGIKDGTLSAYEYSAKNIGEVAEKSMGLYEDLKAIEFSKMISIGNSEEAQYDTTHYFLIPDLTDAENFTLHTYRELPFTVLNENKLEKKKVFHLANEEYFQILKNKVLEENKKNNIDENDYTGVTSNVLKNVANTIDSTNNILSNGLLLVGTVACLANPITGLALIGSSFMPSLLSDAITGSLKGISNKLDISSFKKVNKDAEDKALKELVKIVPTIEINSVLSKFYKSIKNKDYEPNVELPDDQKLLELTLKVIKPIYDPIINDTSFFNKKKVNENIKNYYTVISQ
jgi:hypothetical protein